MVLSPIHSLFSFFCDSAACLALICLLKSPSRLAYFPLLFLFLLLPLPLPHPLLSIILLILPLYFNSILSCSFPSISSVFVSSYSFSFSESSSSSSQLLHLLIWSLLNPYFFSFLLFLLLFLFFFPIFFSANFDPFSLYYMYISHIHESPPDTGSSTEDRNCCLGLETLHQFHTPQSSCISWTTFRHRFWQYITCISYCFLIKCVNLPQQITLIHIIGVLKLYRVGCALSQFSSLF